MPMAATLAMPASPQWQPFERWDGDDPIGAVAKAKRVHLAVEDADQAGAGRAKTLGSRGGKH